MNKNLKRKKKLPLQTILFYNELYIYLKTKEKKKKKRKRKRKIVFTFCIENLLSLANPFSFQNIHFFSFNGKNNQKYPQKKLQISLSQWAVAVPDNISDSKIVPFSNEDTVIAINDANRYVHVYYQTLALEESVYFSRLFILAQIQILYLLIVMGKSNRQYKLTIEKAI